ncbi:hypothetical protein PHLGIDRAFT_125454 [Phlebiopsis gigantea 11061_1 CR5-6]|uniref:DNA damage-binding protein 1 n=1 Tax=Phlebiopsis gigantea (strain 11061_1 CR5-6) TaxID=745531 RepID=A0A0C3SC43_PHLG1|nr:hypothetical protein PHLGIDRAFT_125454 [Phlebiopsis gigantea 11061_1 CR5-6]
MKVITTLHPPSAVISSVKCTLSAKSELGHLVVAKPNRIEVSSLQPEGLKAECSLEIWGRIMSIRAVPAETAGVSNILVLTDHPDPKLILLKYTETEESSFLTDVWSDSLFDRNSRPAEYLTDIIMHPAGRAAVVSCYVGKLRILTFKAGKVDKNFDAILPELNLLALSFLYSESNGHTHTLAIAHIDHRQRIQLLARELDVNTLDLAVEVAYTIPHAILPANEFPFTEYPLRIVSIPPFSITQSPNGEDPEAGPARCRGGVIVLGGRKINFYELSDKPKEKGRDKRRKNSTSSAQRFGDQKDPAKEPKKVKPRATVKWPWSEVAACCPADDEMRRFFIGDVYGRMSLLVLSDTPELILIPLGETSAPTTISYLTSQVFYLGSLSGDSQLIRVCASPQSDIDSDTLPIPASISTIAPSALGVPRAESPDDDYDMRIVDMREARGGKVVKTKGNYIEVLSRFKNIAPILDAVLADPDESGQSQIVTCSGGSNTGALNLIRTGADFQELAMLDEVPNVTNIWPIRASHEDACDKYVLATTLYESYLLRVDGRDSVHRVEAADTGFVLEQRTLAVGNIPRRTVSPAGASSYVNSSLVIQITPHGLALLEYDPTLDTFTKVGNGWYLPQQDNPLWRPREIVAAAINPSQFAVALSGGIVVQFNLSPDNQITLVSSKEFEGREIAAVSCTSFDQTKSFSLYVAVSFWESNTVALLDIKHGLQIKTESTPLPALPRSLLLHNFGTGNSKKEPDFQPYVVAGLADGTVACVTFRNEELKDHKLFSLGTAPVSLSRWDVEGRRSVFATGSRSAVFYWDRQRLRQSPVMLKSATAGSSLNTAGFPACQIIATPSSLVIGQTRGVDKMQIRSIILGLESPRRIAYNPRLNLFGVSLFRTTPARIGDADNQESIFRILDGTTMNSLNEFIVELDEEITAVHALTHRDVAATFAVGTMRNQIGEYEPSAGRLLLFNHSIGREMQKIAEIDVGGCVYAIASIASFIALAVNTSVDLYTTVEHLGNVTLQKVASWNHNYIVASLVAKGNKLIAGDAISSVSILEVAQGSLRTVARDYGPVWPVAIEATRDGGVIVSNTDSNILTFSLPEAREGRVLERTGNYYLGENINKFIVGGLSVQASTDGQRPLFETEHIFFTATGRIGLVHHVNDDISLDLTAIQRNMANRIVGPGQTKHAQWRTPANSRGRSDIDDSAIGFLDGDFLEQFLTHPDQENILEGKISAERISRSVEDVEDILEKLQGLQ